MNVSTGSNPATPLRRLSAWMLDGVSFALAGPAIFFAAAFLSVIIDDFLWNLPTRSRYMVGILSIIVFYAIFIMGWLLVLKLTATVKWQIVSILSPSILLFALSIFVYYYSAYFTLAAMLMGVSSLIAYAIWTLFLFGNGQTVGKRLVEIQAVGQSGMPISWGLMFLREVVKFLLHLFLIGFVIDGVMLLSDKEEHQSVADRIAGTVIVHVGG